MNVNPEEVYRLLAEKYRTFVVPGRCFEMDERHFRIGFGADSGEIEKGLSHLNKALNELSS
jgi:aspartate/methionine/tyrosine aminotransferase